MTGQIAEVIKEGEFYGMQTFDQHLLKHLQAGRITYAEALHTASSPHDFKLLVQADQRLRHMASAENQHQAAAAPAAPAAPVAPAAPAAPAVVADVAGPPAPSAPVAPAPAPVAPVAPAPPVGGPPSPSAPPPGF